MNEQCKLLVTRLLAIINRKGADANINKWPHMQQMTTRAKTGIPNALYANNATNVHAWGNAQICNKYQKSKF